MSGHDKVAWSQGLFLQPHHFQQEARHVENLVAVRARGCEPHGWGFFELVLDEAALSAGRLGILRASGILPDGTTFDMPQHDAMPMPLQVPADLKSETVHLAIPLSRTGVTEVDDGSASRGELRRYRLDDCDVRDQTNAADDPEPVQTAAPNLRLLRERDAGDGHALLGIAHVVERRSDGQVVLDRGYTAPQVRIDASGQLSATASLLHGLVQQRARLLGSRMGQLSHGISELSDFLMLQALNRGEPVLRQHAGAPHRHPNDFYLALLQLAGDLSTFATDERHPPDYPLYRHDDLKATFLPVVDDLRRMLSVVLQRNALQIELVERPHGVRTAVITDPELAKSASFVLAVNAQLPAESLRQHFPAKSKLGPVDRIKDLVNLALPGVGLRLLPVAPRQLPFHAGFHYFELDRGGDLWRQIDRAGSLALFVGGEFPGLELELWAIRQ